MGNPAIQIVDTSKPKPWPPEPTAHNGYLLHLPSQDVGRALKKLPPAAPEVLNRRPVVELEVPGFGLMRVTCELKQIRHRRSSYWTWMAVWADKVDPWPEATQETAER